MWPSDFNQSGGGKVWTMLSVGPPWATVFQVFSTIQGNTVAKSILSLLLRSYTNAIITRMRQAHTCGWVRAPGPTPSAPTSGSRMFIFRVKTLSTRDRHWRNPRKNKYRERSNINARVSVYWPAQCHAKWPRGGRELQHSARIEPKSP